jgi:hypothetical protein
MSASTAWPLRVAAGLAAGAVIAYADNVAFEGEVSPVVIVGMLVAATATAGVIWGRSAWNTAVAAWVWIPMAHVVKHLLGFSDTLHPNTYASILLLAAFTLAVAALGLAAGVLIGGRAPAEPPGGSSP